MTEKVKVDDLPKLADAQKTTETIQKAPSPDPIADAGKTNKTALAQES